MGLEQAYPRLQDKIMEARQAGYSDADIEKYIGGKIEEARKAGHSDAEINEYLGFSKEKPGFLSSWLKDARLGDTPVLEEGEDPRSRLNVAEGVGRAAYGALTMPLAGLAGIAGLATGKPGERLENAEQYMGLFSLPPSKSEEVQMAEGAAMMPFEAVNKAWGKYGEAVMDTPVSMPEGVNVDTSDAKYGPVAAAILATLGELGTFALAGGVAKRAVGGKGAKGKFDPKKFEELLAEEGGPSSAPPAAAGGKIRFTKPDEVPLTSEQAWEAYAGLLEKRDPYLGEVIPGRPRKFVPPKEVDVPWEEVEPAFDRLMEQEVALDRWYADRGANPELPGENRLEAGGAAHVGGSMEEFYGAPRPPRLALPEGRGGEPFAAQAPVPAPPAEGALFPGQPEGFRLVNPEMPPEIAAGEFAPAGAGQPLLAGTERAYRDVGMREGRMTEAELEKLAEDSVSLEEENAFKKYGPKYREQRKELVKKIRREKEARDEAFARGKEKEQELLKRWAIKRQTEKGAPSLEELKAKADAAHERYMQAEGTGPGVATLKRWAIKRRQEYEAALEKAEIREVQAEIDAGMPPAPEKPLAPPPDTAPNYTPRQLDLRIEQLTREREKYAKTDPLYASITKEIAEYEARRAPLDAEAAFKADAEKVTADIYRHIPALEQTPGRPGIRYVGSMQHPKTKAMIPIFQDDIFTGSSFSLNPGEGVMEALRRKQAEFTEGSTHSFKKPHEQTQGEFTSVMGPDNPTSPVRRNVRPALKAGDEIVWDGESATHADTYLKATEDGRWPMDQDPANAESGFVTPSGQWVDLKDAASSREKLSRIHKALVKDAIAEGKEVSPEVLADYPDLTERAGTKLVDDIQAEVRDQINGILSDMPTWEPTKNVWTPEGEFLRRESSTYPSWFKSEFPNVSRDYVYETVSKWMSDGDKAFPKSHKGRWRIIEKIQQIVTDAVSDGRNVVEDHYRDHFRRMMRSEAGSLDIGHELRWLRDKAAKAKKSVEDFSWDEAKKTLFEFFDQYSSIPEMGPHQPKGIFEKRETPTRDSLKVDRYQFQGDVARAGRFVSGLFERMGEFPLSIRFDMFQYLRGEVPLNFLPQEARALAQNLRRVNNWIGRMAVKRGLMSEETYGSLKDSYVHYMYVRHYFGDEVSKALTGSGGTRMDLGVFRQRKDLTYEQQQALGLIEDAQLAVPVGLGRALNDIYRSDYFKTLAENPNVVWPDSIVEIDLASGGKAKWGVERIADEIRIRENQIAQAPATHISPEFKAYTDYLKRVYQEAIGNKEVPAGFTRIPNTRHYGDLAGSFVRTPIANDIIPMVDALSTDSARLWQVSKDVLAKGMGTFKMAKVALNPPTIVRNVGSNLVQMDFSGIPMPRAMEYWGRALDSLIKEDVPFRQARRRGAMQGNWSMEELKDLRSQYEEVIGMQLPGGFAPFELAKRIAKYYGKVDDITKLAIYKYRTEVSGWTPERALVEAQKWGMDYSLASPSIKAARRYFMPFVSYQYKIAPLLAETMRYRPWKFAKYAAIPTVAYQVAKKAHGWTAEEAERAIRMMREATRNKGQFMFLPTKDENGNVQIVDLQFYMPYGNWLEMIRNVGQGDMREGWGQLGVGGWWANFLSVLGMNTRGGPPRDPFMGTEIYSALDDPSTKVYKYATYFARMFAPSSFTSFGAAGYTKRAITGEKDRWDRTVTPAQAAARWLGWNTRSLNPRQINIGKRAQIKALTAAKFKTLKDPSISREEKDRAIQQFRTQRSDVTRGQQFDAWYDKYIDRLWNDVREEKK